MSHCVTMTDIACEIGISMMTISRVINNEGNSNTTRVCTQKIIDRLDDRPGDIARSLLGLNTNAKSVLKDLPEMNPALAANQMFYSKCCMVVQRVVNETHLHYKPLIFCWKVDHDISQMAFT